MPTSTATNTLTINLSRSLTTAEINNFTASISLDNELANLSNGIIVKQDLGDDIDVGSYTISGSTISITLNDNYQITSFDIY